MHCTPPEVFEPVLEALRIDSFGLDPFGNPRSVVPAERVIMLPTYEASEYPGEPIWDTVTYGDAYDFDWCGYGPVWCNGPTSDCKPWAEKMHGETGGDENVSLWPVRTGAKWWQRYVAPSDAICFWEGRVTFLGSKDQAPWHNALSYVGPRADLFVEGMRRYGWCVRNRRDWS